MGGSLADALIGAGILLLAAGLAAKFGLLGWFGHLPGDIRIRGEHGAFYFPIATMVLLSVVLSIIMHLFKRF